MAGRRPGVRTKQLHAVFLSSLLRRPLTPHEERLADRFLYLLFNPHPQKEPDHADTQHQGNP